MSPYASCSATPTCAVKLLSLAAVTNQFTKYYRDGTYDDCPTKLTLWQKCLKTKLSKDELAKERRLEEWREMVKPFEEQHIFTFRPAYADEATKRYGIPAQRPTRGVDSVVEQALDSGIPAR